ncbi:MAG: tetratricopeptide repeat protein [Brevundimonas sp.]
MRHSPIALILTGFALTALVSPVCAQDAPAVAPPSDSPASQPSGLPEAVGDEVAAPAPPVVIAIPAEWSPIPADDRGRSAYGLYLSGRLASIRGDSVLGAELLAQSHNLTPEQPVLSEEAFRTGLFAGRLDTLADLAPSVTDTPLLAEAGRLVMIVRSLGGSDAGLSLAMLRSQPFTEPFATVGRYILPSVAAAAGDWELALAPVEAPSTDTNGLVLRHQRAALLEVRRRFAEAEAEYRQITASPLGVRLFATDYGRFLERRGRRDEAQAMYEASLTGQSPDPDALTGRLRVLDGGAPPPVPTIPETAAAAIRTAAIQIGDQGERQLSAVLLRLAASLGPDDEIISRLGMSLAAVGQEEAAREAFGQVTTANPIVYAGAQFGLGLSFQREDRQDEALEAYRRADAAAPGLVEVSSKLAQQLMVMDRSEEALAVLNRPTVNVAGQAAGVRYLRGATLESLGRIDEAENELWAALTAAPNEPTFLNHLGYMWVDSGRRVEQGAELLARAHAADPENANIQDSLGWAQFRQGHYDIAVETLEGAVSKQPANPEIVNHLGDAYWQVGRRREAQWQWTRVLTLDPDAERRTEVEQKLATGLSVAPSVSAGQN